MRRLGRREVLGGLVASGLALRGGLASAQERAAILDGARKEGMLAFATSVSAAGFPKFMDAFKAKYPFLDVSRGYYSAPTGRVLARVRCVSTGALVNSAG